jgi:hypothetical protein
MSHNNSPNNSNELNIFSKHTRVYGHIDINNGNLLFDRYIDPTEHLPSLEHYSDDLSTNGYLALLPHQENSDENSDSDSTFQKQKRNSDIIKTNPKERPYQIPLNLRKPFKLPLKSNTTVITPQSKAILAPSSPSQGQKLKSTTEEVASSSPTTAPKNTTNDKSTVTNVTDELINPHNRDSTGKEDNKNPSNKCLISSHNFKNILDQANPKVFISSYLDETFRPTSGNFKLPPELALLETLILSQHEALMQPIMDLATINLNLTKILEKKKESTFNLQNDDKIPRSLRIKCELTSSPSYAQHPEFLNLKDQLKHEVDNFITNGTKIMIEWAKINVKLLNYDRCTDILDKALQIPDGLTFFYSNIFNTPQWPSVKEKYLTIFLFKLYVSGQYFDITSLTEYLDMPTEEILTAGTKVFLKTQSEDTASKIITSLDLNDVNMNEFDNYAFITEILLNFDQIIKITTIGIWNQHQEKMKQATAAMKMKAKMKSLEITSATLATAQAISRATNALESDQVLNTNNNL